MSDLRSKVGIGGIENDHAKVFIRHNGTFNSEEFIAGALNGGARILVNCLQINDNRQKKEIIAYIDNNLMKDYFGEKKALIGSEAHKRVCSGVKVATKKRSLFGNAEYDLDDVVNQTMVTVLSVLGFSDDELNKSLYQHFLQSFVKEIEKSFSIKKNDNSLFKYNKYLSLDGMHCEMWNYGISSGNVGCSVEMANISPSKSILCEYDCPITLTNKGVDEMLRKNYLTAKEMFQRAVQIEPNYSKALHWLGVSYYYDNELYSAIEAMEKAFSFERFNGLSGIKLIKMYYQANDLVKAAKQFVAYSEECNPSIHPDFDEIDAFRVAELLLKSEELSVAEKERITVALKKMKSAIGL